MHDLFVIVSFIVFWALACFGAFQLGRLLGRWRDRKSNDYDPYQ